MQEEIRRVADLDVPILLRGETGTGKELVAHAIHQLGRRREQPLVAVNLRAIPPSLAAAELFGAARGAATGATRDQEGYFRRARGATLFLDEIGEAPPDVQVLLLRALETGEIYPLGGQRPEHVDARIIAATDADLEGKARDGTFRLPLLHRLAGYEIRIPPLRERRDDIARLLVHFMRTERDKLGEPWPPAPGADPAALWLSPEVMARLVRYDWPGNVRQLRNVARQLMIASRGRAEVALTPQLERVIAITLPVVELGRGQVEQDAPRGMELGRLAQQRCDDDRGMALALSTAIAIAGGSTPDDQRRQAAAGQQPGQVTTHVKRRMPMSNLTQWSPSQELKDRATSARPALALNNNTLCMAWRGIDGTPIFVSTSTDGGSTWSRQRGLDTHRASNGPALAAFNNMFVMVYRESDGYRMRSSTSRDGLTWSDPAPLEEGAQRWASTALDVEEVRRRPWSRSWLTRQGHVVDASSRASRRCGPSDGRAGASGPHAGRR